MQVSQLYISSQKLKRVQDDFDPSTIPLIPVILLGDKTVMTDGHTRVLAALLRGQTEIETYLDQDELNLKAYEIYVQWCLKDNIYSPYDLMDRIIAHEQYEEIWIKRCEDMEKKLK